MFLEFKILLRMEKRPSRYRNKPAYTFLFLLFLFAPPTWDILIGRPSTVVFAEGGHRFLSKILSTSVHVIFNFHKRFLSSKYTIIQSHLSWIWIFFSAWRFWPSTFFFIISSAAFSIPSSSSVHNRETVVVHPLL